MKPDLVVLPCWTRLRVPPAGAESVRRAATRHFPHNWSVLFSPPLSYRGDGAPLNYVWLPTDEPFPVPPADYWKTSDPTLSVSASVPSRYGMLYEAVVRSLRELGQMHASAVARSVLPASDPVCQTYAQVMDALRRNLSQMIE